MATLIHLSRTAAGSLWQGGAEDVIERGSGYDLIVLCADELQLEASLFLRPEESARTTVLHAPNDEIGRAHV